MKSGLRITHLRNLPVGTFEDQPLEITSSTNNKHQEQSQKPPGQYPCRKHLILDFPSLLEAHRRNIISHLTGNYALNLILIPELLLHFLDNANKKADKELESKGSGAQTVEANRTRDLLQFLYQKIGDKWLVFQKKGVQDDKSFLNDLGIKKDSIDTRLYISWALYRKKNVEDSVLFITSDNKLKKCAEDYGIQVISIDKINFF